MSSPAASRRRHPSTQPPVRAPQVAARVARLLDRSRARHPQVAAAVLAVRGRTGLPPDELARRLGIDADVLRAAEAGELALAALPAPLRARVAGVVPVRAAGEGD
jgi:ribosome-binding protein aMBF1 (putative translation factor)